jgi:4-hydroxy-tetrahydrodipicolinate synthase
MVYEQDQREGVHHFRTLARAVDLPIMIYNNRPAYRLDLTPDSFAELASEENIVAVKESSHDSRRMTDMINRLGDRFRLYCGVDDLVLENVLFGAVGWVSGLANSFPAEAVRLFRAAEGGRVEEALALYRWFMPLLHLDTAVKLVQYIKLCNQMTGMGSEWVRAPRLPLVGEERARIEALVRHALETRPAMPVAA